MHQPFIRYPNQQGSNHSSVNNIVSFSELVTDMGKILRMSHSTDYAIFLAMVKNAFDPHPLPFEHLVDFFGTALRLDNIRDW